MMTINSHTEHNQNGALHFNALMPSSNVLCKSAYKLCGTLWGTLSRPLHIRHYNNSAHTFLSGSFFLPYIVLFSSQFSLLFLSFAVLLLQPAIFVSFHVRTLDDRSFFRHIEGGVGTLKNLSILLSFVNRCTSFLSELSSDSLTRSPQR